MSMFPSSERFPPVVKTLVILNVIMYLITMFLLFTQQVELADTLGLYNIGSPSFKPYQLFTYMFMHAGLMHILFNMLALWMLGSTLENFWGHERFLFFYLSCGFGAGIITMVLAVFGIGTTAGVMVGASGAIFGILVAFAVLFPNQEFMIIPIPIPIKAKYFVPLYVLFELYSGYRPSMGDNVAHFTHLGGGLIGFIIVKIWQRGRSNFY